MQETIEGSEAPDFVLNDAENNEVSLKDFKGKWIVLYFYPKDNTSGCTKEAVDFTELIDDFNNLNSVVIGVSPDSPESHRRFIERHNLKLKLLSDSNKNVLRQYGAIGLKKNYGREYEGVIRSTFIISPEGIIKKIWRNVKVRKKKKDGEEKHAKIVLDTLKSLKG